MFSTSRRTLILGMHAAVDPVDLLDSKRARESLAPTAARPIIGVVAFTTHRGERAEAILDGEGRWRCPRLPVLDRVLNILFEPEREATDLAPFGHVALNRVAAWINGTASVRFDDSIESS